VDSLKALDPERPIREVDCCSQILVRGDDGGRAIGAIDDDDVGWRRRCASYGVIDNRSENLQH
jgi:hypothetical protein